MTYAEPTAPETAAAWNEFARKREQANNVFEHLLAASTKFAATIREWQEANGHADERAILTRAAAHLNATAFAAGTLTDLLQSANRQFRLFAGIDTN